MALFTPKESEDFERKLFANAAENFLEVKHVSQTILDLGITLGSCDKNKIPENDGDGRR